MEILIFFRHVQTDDVNLTFQIDQEDVKNALYKVRKRVSAGPDCMAIQLMRRFEHCLVPMLTHIYNHWINQPLINSYHLDSYMILFNKKKVNSLIYTANDIPEIKQCRPINIENSDSKIFAKILNDKLMSHLVNKLHPMQFSIRGRSIHTPLMILMEIYKQVHLNRDRSTMAFFLDLEKAYDSVCLGYLSQQIIDYCGQTNLAMGVLNYINNKTTAVKYEGYIFDKIKLRKAITQGSPLSPILFAIYMDKLVIQLDNYLHGIYIQSMDITVKILVYADDIVVICSSHEEVKGVIEIFKKFQDRTGSKVNHDKSYLLTLIDNKLTHQFNNAVPDKYLGLPFPFYGPQMRKQVQEKLIQKIQAIKNKLEYRFISLMLRVKIINTYVIPCIVYYIGHVDFTKEFINKITRITNGILWPQKKLIIINRKKLYKNYYWGGLNLIDLELLILTTKANAFIKMLKFIQGLGRNLEIEPTDTPPPVSLTRTSLLRNYIAYTDVVDELDMSNIEQIKYQNIKQLRYATPNGVLSPYNKVILNTLLHTMIFPGVVDFAFKLVNFALPTTDILISKFHMQIDGSCMFCDHLESFEHLFFRCAGLARLRQWVDELTRLRLMHIGNIEDLIVQIIDKRYLLRFILLIFYSIWKMRNWTKFKGLNLNSVQFIREQIKIHHAKELNYLPDVLYNNIWNNMYIDLNLLEL